MLRYSELRCERCGQVLREERAHHICETCGIVEGCCEAQIENLASVECVANLPDEVETPGYDSEVLVAREDAI